MIPKTFRALLDHPKVRDISYEPGNTLYWIYLVPGWYSDDYGLHTIIANTIAEAKRYLSEIQPCDCELCKFS